MELEAEVAKLKEQNQELKRKVTNSIFIKKKFCLLFKKVYTLW